MLGHAREKLELSHGEPQGGVGGPRGTAHGPSQTGHDAGQLWADLLVSAQVLGYVALS
jgi:hypothetical protein